MNASRWLLSALLVWGYPFVPASTCAQTLPPTDLVGLQVRADPDSVARIHQLFLVKRRSAKTILWTGAGVAAGLGLIGLGSHALVNSVKQTTSGQPLQQGAVSVGFQFSLPGLAIVGLGLLRRVRYSPHREAVVVSAYEQGKGLPPSIERSLKRLYGATR